MYKIKTILLYLAITILSLSSCKTVTYLADTEVQYLDTNSFYPKDKAIADMIAPYSDQMSEKMDVVLGQLSEDLVKSRPNSNLGNWFADVLLTEANAMFYKPSDIAIQNYGGLRVPIISKGDLTVGKIYELMPFDNTLVAVDVPGKVIQELMTHIAQRGGWPVSHSLSFKEVNDVATEIMVHGLPLDLEKEYRLAIPDYIANGGDSAEFLKAFPQEESGVFIRDVIIEHLLGLKEKGLPITIDNSKRIH